MRVWLLIVMMWGGMVMDAQALEKTAVFAGGCFWCMESEFQDQKGVLQAVSGYTGGHVANPTYEQVSRGDTGHYEALLVVYDPKVVDYQRLLDIFWSNIDPFDARGQFVDKGSQYRAAIFVADEAERALAEASKAAVEAKHGKPVVTQVLAREVFYPAEAYHQDYYQKNPLHYGVYERGSGRKERLEALKKASE